MADLSQLLGEYDFPTNIPGFEVDPKELERAKHLGMIRMGLGMAGREPIGSAVGAGINTIYAGQASARQQMLARLQAYAAYQKIQAAQQEKAQQDALVKQMNAVPAIGAPDVSNIGPGGPTPANAALITPVTQYQRLLRQGQIFADAGKTEDAKRYFDAAKDLRDKWTTTPTYTRDASGRLRIAQLSETAPPRTLDITPAEEQHFVDTGGAVQGVGKYTGTPGTPQFPKTMSPSERDASARGWTTINQPIWDAQAGQFITRPTKESPTGAAISPTGFTPKRVNAPEAYQKQIGGIVNVNTAIENYLERLKGWSNADLLNTTKRAAIGTAYNNTMLQLKEAYQLGVLNGPDYDILTTVLTDPLTAKGAITSNAAIAEQSKQIRTVLRKNAENLARVYKQPTSDIDALLPPVEEAPPPSSSTAPLTAAEQAELDALRRKRGRQ